MLEIRKNFLEIIKRLKNENIRILNVNLTPKELAKKIFEEINI